MDEVIPHKVLKSNRKMVFYRTATLKKFLKIRRKARAFLWVLWNFSGEVSREHILPVVSVHHMKSYFKVFQDITWYSGETFPNIKKVSVDLDKTFGGKSLLSQAILGAPL